MREVTAPNVLAQQTLSSATAEWLLQNDRTRAVSRAGGSKSGRPGLDTIFSNSAQLSSPREYLMSAPVQSAEADTDSCSSLDKLSDITRIVGIPKLVSLAWTPAGRGQCALQISGPCQWRSNNYK